MVTKCSAIHPKLLRSVHYCEQTHSSQARSYPDETATFGATPAAAHIAYPTKDDKGNPLTTEYGLCVYSDHQAAVVQEMPEHAPAGQLPRSVAIVLDDDLVDKVKPGDRVQVIGVYVALPHSREFSSSAHGGNSASIASTTFRTLLVANNVRQILRDASAPTFTAADMRNIREVGRREDVCTAMSLSLAPSIYGHEAVKRAMLLQMLGGQEKTTASGMHLRGDIHLLLVGDASVAKSQLLRYVLNVAPLAVSTNARGASGVGLTAAVVVDSDTHERSLEAGATVLADRGVVCIDEFDKMDIVDRAALHEVMEQQTVTIQKAGVHASLNARCSVLAAANPIYGSYDHTKSVSQNIGFPPTLLSRFDALFILLDPADPRRDRVIAQHVLRNHREGAHVPLSEAAGTAAIHRTVFSGVGAVPMLSGTAADTADDVSEETPVYAQAQAPTTGEGAATPQQRFSVAFIRKFILYARNRVFPRMTPEAGALMVERFTDFRQRAASTTAGGRPGGGRMSQATLPITARMLESFVRLAEAHARCRLSPTVTPEDAEAAVALSQYALYGEGTGVPVPAVIVAPVPIPAAAASANSAVAVAAAASTTPAAKRRRGATPALSAAMEEIRAVAVKLLSASESRSASVESIAAALGDRHTMQQISEVLRKMDAQGAILFIDGIAHSTS